MVSTIGKRSEFERVPRDYYPTPLLAVEPLINHLPLSFNYIEPCAGDGRLIEHITGLTDGFGRCVCASDVIPRYSDTNKQKIYTIDALSLRLTLSSDVNMCITNPPWDRKFLHPFIWHMLAQTPTWLLFDADWMHTKQSSVLMTYCTKVVSVGRVKWIEGSKNTGKDNCCWYLFDKDKVEATKFFGRDNYEE
jgi:hypothetical protein